MKNRLNLHYFRSLTFSTLFSHTTKCFFLMLLCSDWRLHWIFCHSIDLSFLLNLLTATCILKCTYIEEYSVSLYNILFFFLFFSLYCAYFFILQHGLLFYMNYFNMLLYFLFLFTFICYYIYFLALQYFHVLLHCFFSYIFFLSLIFTHYEVYFQIIQSVIFFFIYTQ